MPHVEDMPAPLPQNSKRRQPNAFDRPPERLPYATEFTDDPQLDDAIWVLRELKRHPQVIDELLAATDLSLEAGRKRLPGEWALVMLAFTLSGHVDVEKFYNRAQSSQIWQIAGFAQRPTYQTVWNRLTELEDHAQAFVDAANKLIARAVKREPRIARHLWVDGTAFHSHSALEHCCTDPAACKALGGHRPAHHMHKASDQLVTESRHEEAEGPADESAPVPGAIEELPASKAPVVRSPKRRRPYRYFEIGGHRYRSLDPDAGARHYGGPNRKSKFWFGGLHQSAVSMFVGAPVAINLLPANQPEFGGWPELLGRTVRATGTKPVSVVMDRGYSFKPVFKFNTEQGIASVIPWRKWKADQQRSSLDTDEYDRHGIPRCKHGGGPGDIDSAGLGLYSARGESRLRFRCELRYTESCSQLQSIACSKEWRLLIPMSRVTKTYHALAYGAQNHERVFRHWRERYLVAGNSLTTRPKRPGIAWQNLRASAALLIEWFRLSLRHGWLGSHRHLNTATPYELKPGERLVRVLNSRRTARLDGPAGAAGRKWRASVVSGPPDDDTDDSKLPF